MESRAFKALFNEVAATHGFEYSAGGWFRESKECIAVLDLQKSNFGNCYELNVKFFFQGMFGKDYVRSKELVKRLIGNVFLGAPQQFRECLNLDAMMEPEYRLACVRELFGIFIGPVVDRGLTRAGIASLGRDGIVYLLPAVQRELGEPVD